MFLKSKKRFKQKYKKGDLVVIKGHSKLFLGLILDSYSVKANGSEFIYKIFWQNNLIIEYNERDLQSLSIN